MRLIDGDELLEILRIMQEVYFDRRIILGKVVGEVKRMPTIEPEPKWIPCSKTTDIPDHEIMACDEYGEIMLGYLAYEDDQWICESDGYEMVDPIAWREKPETYREEGEQDEP